MSDESLWVFGYGSLVWRPAFSHHRWASASISGYARRFWQGSTDHRGVPSRPGRVVTLLREDHPAIRAERASRGAERAPFVETCWGTAYEVRPEDREDVLEGLDHRERGGYDRVEVEITIRIDARCTQTRRGLVYVAEPHNDNYLGPASLSEIARQIVSASGPSGANPEYVFELARSLREMGAEDDHVFGVEAAVARLMEKETG